MSQREVARRSGQSSPVVNRYVKDTKLRNEREVGILKAIATALNVSFDWLSVGEGQPEDGALPANSPLLELQLDPRYPALAEAIRYRGAAWLPDTSKAMAGQADHALTDRTVGQWIDEGDILDRQNRKKLPHGRPLVAEDDTPPTGRR